MIRQLECSYLESAPQIRKIHINQKFTLINTLQKLSVLCQLNLVHLELVFLTAVLSNSCAFSNANPLLIICHFSLLLMPQPCAIFLIFSLSSLLSITVLLKSFYPPSPKTRRTFKVCSDNVTAAVHLFPILCN